MERLILPLLNLVGGVWRNPPVIVVLLLNLIPAACVLWLGWSILPLLLLYWLENLVVGAINVLKIAASARDKPNGAVQAAGLIPFFILHYGLFCVVHGVFTVLIGGGAFDDRNPMTDLSALWADRESFLWALAGITALHLVNLFMWMKQEGWRQVEPQTQMFEPYGRIIVLHITILGGAFLIDATGAPASAIILLAVVKTVIEVLATAYRERLLKAAKGATVEGAGLAE